MRGHRTAYLNLFDEPDVMEVPPPERRGRSEDLINKRNECLLHRHYYYIKIVRKQYQDTLDELEKEFFITQSTIVQMMQRSSLLKQLNAEKPTVKYFRDKFPWLVW